MEKLSLKECFDNYSNFLANKNIKLCFNNKEISLLFEDHDFLHLSGLAKIYDSFYKSLSSSDRTKYPNYVNGTQFARLLKNDFNFEALLKPNAQVCFNKANDVNDKIKAISSLSKSFFDERERTEIRCYETNKSSFLTNNINYQSKIPAVIVFGRKYLNSNRVDYYYFGIKKISECIYEPCTTLVYHEGNSYRTFWPIGEYIPFELKID